MKKVLLSIGVLAAMNSLNAQVIFYDDFSSGTLGNWNVTDADADGSNWIIRNYSDGVQNEHASSESWNSTAGALTPNNWMISDPIDLTGYSGTIHLEWLVYAQDQSWANEHYTVYVATANDITSLTASGTTFTETVGTSSGYMARTLDVSGFGGSTIYVAFRHHACTDQFRLNIDDVKVRQLQPLDAELSALNVNPIIIAGNYTIQGTVKNVGVNSITSFDVVWDSGSGPNAQTFTTTIAPGASYNFSHGTPLNAVAGSNYTLNVCVDLTGDGDATNDCMSAMTSVATQEGTRLPLMEEFSSSTCPPCYTLNTSGFGGIGMNNYLANEHANEVGSANLAVIKYQVNWPGSGDHAYNPDVAARVTYYNINAAPTVLVDAGEISAPSGVTAAAAVPTYVDLSATHSTTGGVLTVNVTATPYASWSNVKLHIALLDKEYPAGTAASFSNGETEFHHVARKLVPSSGGTTVNLVGGTPYTTSKTYTYSWNTGYPAQGSYDLHAISQQEVVVFLQDADGNILNAAISVGEFAGVEEENNQIGLSIYPNPAVDAANIYFNVQETSNVTVQVMNSLGQMVYTNNLGEVNGSQMVQFNTTDLNSGVYLVNVIVGDVVTTKRISVSK